jgi:Na+/phosphate symporter
MRIFSSLHIFLKIKQSHLVVQIPMPSQIPTHWQNEITIRNENTRFALMFILFTLLAFLITLMLFIFVNKSYQTQSEIFQRHFIAYCILASISLALFLIFFIGSLVYTSKSLSSSNRPAPLPRLKFNNLVTQTDV